MSKAIWLERMERPSGSTALVDMAHSRRAESVPWLTVVRTGRQCHVVPAGLDVGVAHKSKENVGGNGSGFQHFGE